MAEHATAVAEVDKAAADAAKAQENQAFDQFAKDHDGKEIPLTDEPVVPEGDDDKTKKADADPDPAAAPDEPEKKDDDADPKPDAADPDPDPSEELKLTEQQQAAVKRMGLSDELVEAMGDQAGQFIDELGDTHSRQMGKIGNKMRLQLEQARKDAAAETDTGKEVVDDQPKPEPSPAGEVEKITEEDLYEPGQAVTKLNAVLAQVNALTREVQSFRDNSKTEQDRGQHEEAERFFAGLVGDKGKTTFPEFGIGPSSRLLDGSPEKTAREAHRDEGLSIQLAYGLRGDPMTLTEAMQIALDHKGRDRLDKAAQETLRKEIAKRKSQGVARPGGARRAPVDTQDAKANRMFDKFARDHDGKVIPP